LSPTTNKQTLESVSRPVAHGKPKPAGTVAFVGAGPGDPGLLTVRAVQLLAEADVVVVDYLTRDLVLAHCGPEVEVVDGALGEDGQPLAHATRAKLVTSAAKAGKRVVRVLDGDPVLYGGVSEEAAACAKARIPFEIVPGISSVTAVPAYAGIPLTTAKARELRVVNVSESEIDWPSLGAGDATLVLLGAVGSIDEVVRQLIAAGRKPGTPVAVTRAAMRPRSTFAVSNFSSSERFAKRQR